jgi:hypothetical protein
MFRFTERVFKDRKENIFHGILYPKCHNCEEFFDFSRLKLPLDLWTVERRIKWNRRIYMGNYIWIILILAFCTSRGMRQIGVLFSLWILWIILCALVSMISSPSRTDYLHDARTKKMMVRCI